MKGRTEQKDGDGFYGCMSTCMGTEARDYRYYGRGCQWETIRLSIRKQRDKADLVVSKVKHRVNICKKD